MPTRADRLTGDDVLDVVRSAVAVVMEVDPDRVDRHSTLRELGVDSLALVSMAEVLEQQLSAHTVPPLHIPDADLAAMVRVGDTVDYVLARLSEPAGARP
jgi:acyl carrier protein